MQITLSRLVAQVWSAGSFLSCNCADYSWTRTAAHAAELPHPVLSSQRSARTHALGVSVVAKARFALLGVGGRTNGADPEGHLSLAAGHNLGPVVSCGGAVLLLVPCSMSRGLGPLGQAWRPTPAYTQRRLVAPSTAHCRQLSKPRGAPSGIFKHTLLYGLESPER